METGDATAKMIGYIEQNHISVAQMSADLGIPEEKFQFGSEDKFTAEEFLEICVYLNLRPEQFTQRGRV